MPSGKKYRRKKRRPKKIAGIVVPRRISSMTGFPENKVVQLKYVDRLTMTSAVGAHVSWLFRCNSINDPDYTGVGHRPIGYNEWANFYNHYTVLSSKITVEYVQRPTEQPVLLCLRKQPGVGSSTNFTEEAENKNSSYTICSADQRGKLVNSFNLQSYLAVKDPAEDEVKTDFGFNPNEQAFYNLSMESSDIGITTTCNFLVTIDYTVLMIEPKDLLSS